MLNNWERELYKNSTAYQTVLTDKKNGTLSHAYLICTDDSDGMMDILKEFAKLITATGNEEIDQRLVQKIDNGMAVDVVTYPKDDSKQIKTDDVEKIVTDCYLKPYELDCKLYVLGGADDINHVGQNKLLKTLEEPNETTRFLLGTAKEHKLLDTIKSRVKKINLDGFSTEQIVNALENDYNYGDKEKLIRCAKDSGGNLGKTKKLYYDETYEKLHDFVVDVLVNMNKSADVYRYSERANAYKDDLGLMLDVFENRLGEMLEALSNKPLLKSKETENIIKNAPKFNLSAVVWGINAVEKAKEMLYFNTNALMTIEWLFYQILEGKYKWRE